MRPKLLLILALGPGDLVGGLCKELYHDAKTGTPWHKTYDVYVECINGEDGACRSSAHDEHLRMLRTADCFEIVVIGGSILNDDVEELLFAVQPDVDVENYAMPGQPLDMWLRHGFSSPNHFVVDGTQAVFA